LLRRRRVNPINWLTVASQRGVVRVSKVIGRQSALLRMGATGRYGMQRHLVITAKGSRGEACIKTKFCKFKIFVLACKASPETSGVSRTERVRSKESVHKTENEGDNGHRPSWDYQEEQQDHSLCRQHFPLVLRCPRLPPSRGLRRHPDNPQEE
jgi:hypothetical protein